MMLSWVAGERAAGDGEWNGPQLLPGMVAP